MCLWENPLDREVAGRISLSRLAGGFEVLGYSQREGLFFEQAKRSTGRNSSERKTAVAQCPWELLPVT
jgi:hypothetical protein